MNKAGNGGTGTVSWYPRRQELYIICILSENPEKQKPGKPLQWALRSHRAFMPSVTPLSFKASFTAKGMTLVMPPGLLKPTEGKTEKTDEG